MHGLGYFYVIAITNFTTNDTITKTNVNIAITTYETIKLLIMILLLKLLWLLLLLPTIIGT